MKFSQLFLPTLKETPQEAEIVSHKLLLRAGLVRKLASGLYSFLPLGYKIIQKIENIIRQEMNKKGGQEVLLPLLQPAELWKASGRWEEIGEELIRLSDRNKREFILSFTHEEVISDLVKKEIRSYRDLPLLLYQIQVKFRDEIRPRFGIIRTREFIMKDGYSFNKDLEGLDVNYKRMQQAYTQIFTRCGLRFKMVEAEPGLMGGNLAYEFMAMANSGEDVVVSCEKCDYAANLERAEAKIKPSENKEPPQKLEKVETPNIKTIEKLAAFLKAPPQRMIKTLIYETEKEIIAVLIRGDYEVNEKKLRKYLACSLLNLASKKTVEKVSGAPLGFSGPVGLNIKIIADYSVVGVSNFITGANKKDYHLINVNMKRDFSVDEIIDLKIVKEGDSCPHCQGNLNLSRGIEIGHIFKLGTKYSKSLGVTFLDRGREKKFVEMGCYGIGVTRLLSAIVEQNYDKDGIIWPFAVAPYAVIILILDMEDEKQVKLANELYDSLNAEGIDVLLDEREEQPGVKFKEADLIGIPLRITISSRTFKENKIEIKIRRTGEIIKVEKGKIIDKIKKVIA